MSCSSCPNASPAPFAFGGFPGAAAAAPLGLGLGGFSAAPFGALAGNWGSPLSLGAAPFGFGGLNQGFALNGPLGLNSLGSFGNLGNLGNFGNFGAYDGLGLGLGLGSLASPWGGYGGLGAGLASPLGYGLGNAFGNLGYGAF